MGQCVSVPLPAPLSASSERPKSSMFADGRLAAVPNGGDSSSSAGPTLTSSKSARSEVSQAKQACEPRSLGSCSDGATLPLFDDGRMAIFDLKQRDDPEAAKMAGEGLMLEMKQHDGYELLQAGADAQPMLFTICSSDNLEVLYQNSASLGYAGDLRSTQVLSDSNSSYLMQLLSLQPPEMVEEVMEAIRKDDGPWVRVMQVPPSLVGQAHQQHTTFAIPAVHAGLVSFEHPSATTWPMTTAPSLKALMDTGGTLDASLSGSVAVTAKSGLHKTGAPNRTANHLAASGSFLDSPAKKYSSTPHPAHATIQTAPSNVIGLDSPVSIERGMLPSPLSVSRNRRASSSWLVQQLEPHSEGRISGKPQCAPVTEDELQRDGFGGSLEPQSTRQAKVFVGSSRGLAGGSKSFGPRAPVVPSQVSTTRNRLQHLLRNKTPDDSSSSSTFWSNPNAGRDSQQSQQPPDSPQRYSAFNLKPAPGMGTQEFFEKVQGSHTGTDPSRGPSDPSRGYVSGPGGFQSGPNTEEFKCWHEITISPFTNPKTGQKVFMVSQIDVTQRCQLEQRLMQVTEAQLHMLENMFPRHILERIMQATSAADQNPQAPMSGAHSSVSSHAQQAAEAHRKLMPLPTGTGHTSTYHDCVTIMFTDIVGFTTMSESVQPQQVMAFLNDLFSEFDELVAKHKVSKVETAGDCFIICAGILEEDDDGFMALAGNQAVSHTRAAKRVLNFAAEMMHVAQRFTMPNGQPVRQRVGIHSGPVASGLIGNLMPKFSLFGDTMNTASRMESTSIPGRIQVSEASHALLKDAPKCWECTGGVEVKGKGTMVTYLLTEAAMLKPFSLNPTGNSYAQLLETSMDAMSFARGSIDYGGRGGRQSIDYGGRSGRLSIDLGGRPSAALMKFSAMKSFNRTQSSRKSLSMNRHEGDSATPGGVWYTTGAMEESSSGTPPGPPAPGAAPPHRLSMVATAHSQDLTHAVLQLRRQHAPRMAPHAQNLISTILDSQTHLGLLLETLKSVGNEDGEDGEGEDEFGTIGSLVARQSRGGDISSRRLSLGSGPLSKLSRRPSNGFRPPAIGRHSGSLTRLAQGSGPLARLEQLSDAGIVDASLIQLT